MPHQGRNENRNIISLTKRDMFKQLKTNRNLDSARILASFSFNRITDSDLEDLEYDSYVWTRGDRFYKLASDFYNQVDYWWVIALFNNAPTEQHIALGEEIFIPRNPEIIVELLGIS